MSKIARCYTESEIISNGGAVVENNDGTISVYAPNSVTGTLTLLPLTKPCCEALRTPALFFDKATQKCYWSNVNTNVPLNVVLNPRGNDGAIFSVESDESCTLSVEFDYLFKFSGNTLTELANGTLDSECETVTDVFESLSASMVISTIKPTSTGTITQPVYESVIFSAIGNGNLYSYLNGKSATTGFYVTCQSTSDEKEYPINLYNLKVNNNVLNCNNLVNQLTTTLFNQSGLPQNTTGTTQFRTNVNQDAFASNWLRTTVEITDPVAISAMTNEKIKLNIRLSGVCIDFCVLVDNIELNKKCVRTDRDTIFITKSPGFELDRIRDNKKSWLANTDRTHRTFKITKYDNTSPIRYTDYYLDDYRQVINTKEIDLDINIAAAVETDVWGYMVDNPCLLTGVTIGTTTKSKDVLSASTTSISVSAITITAFTAVPSVTVVTAVTSNTVTTTTNVYSCPAGFTATPANDQCQFIDTVVASVPVTTPLTIAAGRQNSVYGRRGAWFYPPITANSNLPYRVNSSTQQLVDSVGTVITPIAINTTYPFWASNNSDTTGGRLNNVGLFAPSDTASPGLDGWVGFSRCLNIETAGTYYVGLAADNYCRFKVNGNLVAAFTALTTFSFNVWHVFPISLNSGLNFIEMEGLNEGTTDSAFGAEIYYPTGATPFATLTAATSTASTQANMIFSTVEYIGGNWEIGGGYTCPTGYILSYCDGPTPNCVQRITQPITVTQVTNSTTNTGYSFTNVTTYTNQPLTGITFTSGTVPFSACTLKEYCASEYCGDENINVQTLLTQPLSSIQTIEDFQYYMTSELIDAKNRKIISSYATLRLLYERYMNSIGRCTTPSSKFDYYSMNRFANLVGNYWVELIEQVIPATTIWGSTRVYSNTLFDTQKFKYKPYSLLFGENQFGALKPSTPATGRTCNTSATTKTILGNASGTTLFTNQGNEATFSSLYVLQFNSGAQYFGSVRTIGPNSPCGENGSINNCDLAVQIENKVGETNTVLKAIPILPIGNVTYNWTTPTGTYTTQSITATSSGTYTVVINDDCCEATATFNRGNCNLSVTLTSTNPNTDQNDGSVTATPSGQAGTVSYLWSNGQTTQTISNLSAGTYDVTVTDSAFIGCTVTATTSIYETFSLRAESVTGASIYNIISSTNYDIDWGDGVVSAFTAGDNFMSSAQGHIYESPYTPYTGNINIRSLNLSGVTRILTNFGGASGGTNARLVFSASQLSQLTRLDRLEIVNAHLSGDTADLPRTLTRLISNNGQLYGSTYGLPSGMTFLSLGTAVDRNIISGDTLGLPRTLTGMTILGQNTISGNISGYPTGLTSMSIAGNNTVSGNTLSIPRGGTAITFAGSASIFGNIGNIPTGTTSFISQSRDNISGNTSSLTSFTQLRTLVIENDDPIIALGTGNTITGDINNLPKGITFLNIAGFNTISGDIKDMITGSTAQTGYFNIRGNNTISGNISGASNNFINFILGGSSNTLSGDTSGIPSTVQIMLIGGQNTLSGDLGSIKSGVTFIDIGGRNSIDTYTGKTWTNGLNRLRLTASTIYNTGYTTTQLDQLLNDLTGYTWANNSSFALFNRFGRPIITLIGTASTVSAAARVKLSGSTGSGGNNINLTLV